MQLSKIRNIILALSVALLMPAMSSALTPGAGWGQMNRNVDIAKFWDQFTNRHYGGYNHALQWPGGWDTAGDNDQRRTYANYKGFVIGAKDVPDPQFPTTIWPYMVGQRDGRNDGEQGTDILDAAPDVTTPSTAVQILFKGRLDQRTFRQAYPVVSVDGQDGHPDLIHYSADNPPPGWAGTLPDDGDYQYDVIDPNLPADLVLTTASATRMGLQNNRRVYSYVDRNNDDYMFWHWRIINDGIWGRMHVDRVDEQTGSTHGTVQAVMFSLMFQWDRSSRGAIKTNSAGDGNNDSIWNYYGIDYDAASPTEDMRLVWVRDGDQDPSKFTGYTNGSQDDIGDPDPVTGELLSAKDGGLLMLHFDRSTTDRRDDPGQPRTIGWVHYSNLIQTGSEGMEMKYNQMLLGVNDKSGVYYQGDIQETPLRGKHPNADTDFASWIKASNDPDVSGAFWPGKVLGVDPEVTDIEQQFGYGPNDIPANDTLNMVFVLSVNGVDTKTCQVEGAKWMAGTITDAQKDALVLSAKDSLFATMRQAKSVYESATFDDGQGGTRFASTRDEFETALGQAMTAGKLALSPPAPASLTVTSAGGKGVLAWTLNTTTGSTIAGWRVYRAEASYKGDSVFTKIADLPASATGYEDTDVNVGFSYYYYVTTYDADGNESTMFTRTSTPMVPTPVSVSQRGRPAVFELRQNAPNPFNPSTTIRFSIPQPEQTSLDIYTVDGRLVRTLVNGSLTAGIHEVSWDGTDATGKLVASGIYLYRLASGNNVQVRRMVLIK